MTVTIYHSWGSLGLSEKVTGKWECESCGMHNDPEARFCWNCRKDQNGETREDE